MTAKKTFPLPTTLVPNRESRSWNADILYKMMLKNFPAIYLMLSGARKINKT